MPFKSSKGRNLGKKLPVQKSSDIGKSLGSGGGASEITEFVGATGGLISEYRKGGTYYKAHIFFEPGTFTVTSPEVNEVDVLLVGGGGGGSTGGGAGGGVVYQESHSVSATGYSIVVGPGGLGRSGPQYLGQGSNGIPSTAFGYTAGGGGGGGAYNGGSSTHVPGAAGVSGGGGGWCPTIQPGGSSTGASGHPGGVDVVSPNAGWGNNGGNGGSPGTAQYSTGGGGGAVGGGGHAAGGNSGGGGDGAVYTTLNGEPISFGGGGGGGMQGTNGKAGRGGAGGGGAGGVYNATAETAIGGSNGGEPGSSFGYRNARPGNNQPNGTGSETGLGGPGGVGSGGGGGGMGVSVQQGGHGGPGICIVRYATPGFTGGHTAVDRLEATGGMVYIDYENKKATHYFVNPGTFTVPSPINADFLIVGAGGGGGADNGGGGGGGEVAKGTDHPFAFGTYNVYVGKGGKSKKLNNNHTSNRTEGPGEESGGNGYWSYMSNSANTMVAYARGGTGGNGSTHTAAVPLEGPYVYGTGRNFAGGGSGGGGAGVSDPGPAAPMTGVSAGSGQTNTPTITYHSGNNGGNGTGGPLYNAGGGGAAGGNGHPGASGSPDVSGNGANGVPSNIFGSMLPADRSFFGAGGGGGEWIGPNEGAGNGGAGGGGGGCGGDSARTVFGTGGAGFASGRNGNDPQSYVQSDGGIGTGGGGGGDARGVPTPGTNAGHGGPGIVAISYTINI